MLLSIGTKIVKKSGKPFKSGKKIGTVRGYLEEHPVTGEVCYYMEEDASYVEAFRCIQYVEQD